MIREANANDISSIIDFQLKMALETENLNLNKKVLTEGVHKIFKYPSKGKYFVAEINEKVIGSTMITYEWSDWRNGTVIWLQSVYILPEYRGQKIFSRIYKHIKQIAEQDTSIAGIRLYVDKTNQHAQSVYQTLGMNGDHYATYEWMK